MKYIEEKMQLLKKINNINKQIILVKCADNSHEFKNNQLKSLNSLKIYFIDRLNKLKGK